jgi:uncharacterized protein with PIN domain
MSNKAQFRFYEELNEFLSREWRKVAFDYCFKGNPGIKDPIEAMGVPHTEVELIIVNGQSVGFDYKLRNNDCVSVYPVFEAFDVAPLVRLREKPLRKLRFIVDVNLGQLARNLRLLGFDCLYQNDYTDAEVIALGVDQKRTILTRDRRLLFHKCITHGCLILENDPDVQTRKVIKRFQLENCIEPFHRCLECNGLIIKVEKHRILEFLYPKTRRYYDEFYRCNECNKVYWQGPHFDAMRKKIESFR